MSHNLASVVYDYQAVELPPGADGTRETLRIMARLAKEGRKHPQVRLAAIAACQKRKQKDYMGEARACSEWVRDEVRYIRDIMGIETLQTPDKTLEVMAGDCDDKVTLLGAMLLSIQHPVRFIAIGQVPGFFNHVYCETKVATRWVPCETTEPWEFGRAPRKVASYMRVHV